MNGVRSFDEDYERAVERVKEDVQVSGENRQLILEFAEKCVADGLSKGRLCKLLYVSRYLAGYLCKPFKSASKKDIQAVVVEVEKNSKYSDWTKYDFKVVLKKFYKWLLGNDENFPDNVRWIKPRIRGGKRILPDDLITEDEAKRIGEAADHPRDKALVMVLYESGCRIGELLSLKLKNVQFDDFGAVLRVSGKTGDRRVRIVSSAPLLASWMDIHLDRDNPDAVLWAGRYERYRKEVPTYETITKRLRVLAAKAGVKRRIYPHLFRHSRATSLANKLTEAQMKEHFGWVQSSKMASVYVHLSGRDVDHAILKTYGMIRERSADLDQKFHPKPCSRCHHANSPISRFCGKCGFVLDVKTAYGIENQQTTANGLMNELFKDPEVKDYLAKKVLQLGLQAQVLGNGQ